MLSGQFTSERKFLFCTISKKNASCCEDDEKKRANIFIRKIPRVYVAKTVMQVIREVFSDNRSNL